MAVQFYRDIDPITKRAVFKEVGTDRYIGPTEFKNGAGFIETNKPVVKRTEDGGIAKYATSKLSSYEENQKFLDLVKEVMNKKQNFNKDLQSSEVFWRSKVTDPMTLTDEKLRLLSPEKQQALRESAYATANAGIAGLSREREYRGQRMSDTLGSLASMQEAKMKDQEAKNKRISDAEANKNASLDRQIQLLKLGDYTQDPSGNLVRKFSSASADAIAEAIKAAEGGLDYNYSVPGRQEKGAYQFMPSTWKSWSRQYADSVLQQSVEELPLTQENQDAVAKWKIQSWLDQGYTPQEVAALWNSGQPTYIGRKGTSSITGEPYDVEKYVERFSKKLGDLVPIEGEGLEVTDAQKLELMKKSGLTEAETKGYTADDWAMLDSITRDASIDEGIEVAKELIAKKTSPEQAIAALNRKYGKTLDAADIDSIMLAAGYLPATAGAFSATYKLP